MGRIATAKAGNNESAPEAPGPLVGPEHADGVPGRTGARTKKKRAKPQSKLARKVYEKELHKLQTRLCRLQEWVVREGLRVVVVLEGRDAAGKGGLIRAITERLSPRVFRVVALPAPSEKQKSQIYLQRFLPHFPGAGEVVIFDRSWYNRAGVERVLGFCSPAEYERFLKVCPLFEEQIVDAGIILIKVWLEVGEREQRRRFKARIEDPLRQWKLSPTDLQSRRRWYEYSLARDRMLEETDTVAAPWRLVRSDDKRRARLNCISFLLDRIPFEEVPRKKVRIPKRSDEHMYDDEAPVRSRQWIDEKY